LENPVDKNTSSVDRNNEYERVWKCLLNSGKKELPTSGPDKR